MCTLKEKENGRFHFLQTCSVLSVRSSQISMTYENWEGGEERRREEENREEKFIQSGNNNYLPEREREGNHGHKFEVNVCVDWKWVCWHCFNDITGDLLNPGLNRK